MTKVKPIPEGYHSLVPYITVKDAASAIEFYKKAFNAKEIGRLSMPDGKIGHAELQVGDSRFMLAEEMPEWGNKSPQSLGGTPVGMCLYVEHVDAAYKQAISAGAKVDKDMEPQDQFYGDRSGSLIDPFGHRWVISTHIEDVSFAEMQIRMNKLFEKKD